MSRDTRPYVGLLITDLDNTLYDWFAMWYASFSSMLEALVSSSGVDRETLMSEIREVYQRRGTSEYSYLLNELPSLVKLHPNEDISEVYSDAVHNYRSARKSALRLYPTVKNSLLHIKNAGVPIVAYTESLAYYSSWRLRELHLDRIMDYLYSPPDNDFPAGVSPELLRSGPAESYKMSKTKHRITPTGLLKPSPEILGQIIREMDVKPSATVYLGDSLMKDVAMAQRVGAIDVLAQYGEVQRQSEYQVLRRVSHWTDEDVQREKEIILQPHISPTYTLHHAFGEILDLFRFGDQ